MRCSRPWRSLPRRPARRRAQLITLPVPTVTIYPGELIDADRLTERDVPPVARSAAVTLERTAMLVGKVAKRTLLPDHPIPANAIGEVDS